MGGEGERNRSFWKRRWEPGRESDRQHDRWLGGRDRRGRASSGAAGESWGAHANQCSIRCARGGQWGCVELNSEELRASGENTATQPAPMLGGGFTHTCPTHQAPLGVTDVFAEAGAVQLFTPLRGESVRRGNVFKSKK